MRALLLPVSALLFGAGLLVIGNGLQGLLIPFRAHLEGFATSSIGLIAAGYFAGFVLGCWTVPMLIRRVGHIRTFAVLAAMAACAALGLVLLLTPLSWAVLRAVAGYSFAGLFMVIESWLNARAENRQRGQLFAVYMVINYLATMAGQNLLAPLEPASFVAFAGVCIFLCLALVPVSLTTSPTPPPPTTVRLHVLQLFRQSPVGLVGCFAVGMTNGSFWGLVPVFAQETLMSATKVALYMSAAVAGGAVIQLPLGRISDRIDRRLLILITCVLAALVTGIIAAFPGTPMTLGVPYGLLLGCTIFPIYSLCVAHTNDRSTAENFVEISSILLLTYGVGAVVGPLISSWVMESVGSHGVFIVTCAAYGLLALYTLARILIRERVPSDEAGSFVPVPKTSPAAFGLDPRASASGSETTLDRGGL